jgi:hypothetical protein
LNPICVTSDAGTITPNTPFLINRSNTYRLEVYQVNSDSSTRLIQSFTYQSVTSFQENLRNYAILHPLILFGWILIIGFGLFGSNLPLIGIIGILLAIIEIVVFPNVLTLSGAILKVIISFQIIYFGRKKEDYQ